MAVTNNPVFVRRRKPCPKHTKIRPIIAPTSKFISMKKFFLSICTVALAVTGVAQDASQPQGSWYLGMADATDVLNIFSSGIDIAPTVGYAVADDIVVSLSINNSVDTLGNVLGGTSFDDLSLNLGAQYFMGDYYVGIGLNDPANNLGLDLNAGRYIPFKDVLYITPQVGLMDLTGDPLLGIKIGMGARF